VITADEARVLAQDFLVELEAKVGRPLALWDGQFGRVGIEDHGDVWTVAWNSVAYLESGSIFDQALSGPIAVPKDGSELFLLGTWSRSIDEMLEARRAETAAPGS
jgi:hypothetical protein